MQLHNPSNVNHGQLLKMIMKMIIKYNFEKRP